MQNKPEHLSSDELSDEQLLQQALEGVVPLKQPATTDSKKPRRRHRKTPHEPEPSIKDDELHELSAAHEQFSIDSDNTHRKNGVQLRSLKRLKRGHYPVEDQFDLHHLNTLTGESALLEFISYSCQQNLKCVRIIHGKGLHSVAGPKLKLMTRDLLRSHSQVMAFSSCKSNAGGDGATDVLLKS